MDQTIPQLEGIYTDFHPKIIRYLTTLVGDGEAEDLAQEVFIKAAKALPDFRGEASLSTWLYRIATNTAYDRLRSLSFRQTDQTCKSIEQFVDIVDCDVWSGTQAPLTEQKIVKKEMGDCILKFVARLPENYRAVLLLSYLEGFSNREIADILEITLDAVKIRLHRARTQLKEEFETRCEHYWVSELGWRTT
jgi:RNA polymerase sigma-70 factor, ECF subfamily